jgi:ABC-type transporter Mla subunit MlaD
LKKQSAGGRRWLAAVAGALVVFACILLVALAMSAGGAGGGYRVRAIFDNAGNVISGEDVKIDGVKVGSVGSVTPTPEGRAAVVIDISNPGFQDFRADASCQVRPQALIGEKFVDCLPTQPRVEGTPLPPPLKRIPAGQEGAGEWLLPVTRTHSPVDPDLLGDINRLPERQRFTIILNELGATFAGRGKDLNAIIKRANPALQELEAVLSILASENRVLTHLAVEGDRALAPLAADRGKLSDFLTQSNTLAQATARHRGALAQDLADFPAFLRQLGPAMERLGRFADQTTPTFRDLRVAAPGLGQAFRKLKPFSGASEAFFESFGKSGKVIAPEFERARALLTRAKSLGAAGKPFAGNFSALLTNFRSTGGLERLLDFIYMGTGVENGYDSLGHFLRGEIVASAACLSYAVKVLNCTTGKFIRGSAARASAVRASGTSLVMARTLAVLEGMSPAQAIAKYPGSLPGEERTVGGPAAPPGAGSTVTQPVGGAASGTTYYTPTEESSEASGMLLNYLLGN